jgi:LPS export ABC transporter protein LptC
MVTKWTFKALLLALGVSLALPSISGAQEKAPPPLAAEKQGEMREIRLTEIQGGDKKWVLQADNADYIKDKDRILLSRVEVEIYGQDGSTMTITADAGLIGIKSRDLTLKGNVQAKSADYTFTGEEVHYDPHTRTLTAPGPVKLAGARLVVEGRDLTVDLKQNRLNLAQHTKTRLRPSGGLWNF